MTFKQYFEEKFAFTGSKNLARGVDLSWQEADGDTWVCGFSYNFKTKVIEDYPDISSTPDEYFVDHDLYSVTLQRLLDDENNPLKGFLQKYPNALKDGTYYWISFESYEWGSRTASTLTKVPRNARLILQTVVAALDQKLTPSDNICFSADANDRSRNSLYSHLARDYAKSTNKEVVTQKDGDEIVYLVH